MERCDRWLQVTTPRLAREPVEQGRGHAPSYPHPRSTQSQRHQVARPDQHNMALVRENMRRSLVCGALWYVALYGGHLTGPDHYVAKLQISFFSGTGGTAVSLASGSRFVTPTLDRTRPRSRHMQYTHARYRRLHALLQKMEGTARVSPLSICHFSVRGH